MKETHSNLGKQIKYSRLRMGMTLEEFGQQFSPVASSSIVSRWERGVSVPNPTRIKQLIELTGIDFMRWM